MESTDIARWIVQVVVYAVFVKTIMGLHFPWERCSCCGKKFNEHKPNKE